MRKGIRIGAFCLAALMLVGVVAALSYDFNGDGKTNIWDLQYAINQGKSADVQAAALQEAMGNKGDELHKNAQGQWEIWSQVGLYNMVENAQNGDTFLLMADIDLGGKEWEPIAFKGVFEGNGHTISNLKINKSVPAHNTYDMGFFGVIDLYGENARSQIRQLHLQNVELTIDDNAKYAGLLVGSNWGGIVEGCTTTGIIIDRHTSLTQTIYVGALVGRNANSTPAGTVVRGTDLLVGSAGTDNPQDQVTGLTSIVAMDLAPLTSDRYQRTTGLVGYSKAENMDKAMLWQDASNNTELLSATEQQRRQTVVDYMYQMGTVKWTPSETITFTRNHDKTSTHSNIFVAGSTYTGLPYVGGMNGSYERFMSQMQTETDDQGRYVTVTGLENGERIAGGNTDGTTKTTGFIRYMGNNCSYSISWAWAQVTPTRVRNDDGKLYGGTLANGAGPMVPCEYNTYTYGVHPVGGYQVLTSNTEKYSQCQDAKDTQELIALNGNAVGMAEFYAKAHKGDVLVYNDNSYNATTQTYSNVGAHTRMIAADPVIVRDYRGNIDLERSYVITHEQGDGLFDNDGTKIDGYTVKYTSWRINHKYTLSVLLSKEGYDAYKKSGRHPGCGWGYVPVTMEGFTNGAPDKTPYYSAYSTHPIALPTSGWYYSNYWINSATMVIRDASGAEVYRKTAFLTDRRNNGFSTFKMEKEFADVGNSLEEGKEYTCTLQFLASNGTVTTKHNNVKFVYTPVTPPEDIPDEPSVEGNE